MPHSAPRTIATALVIVLSVVSGAMRAQEPSAWFGTWRLNIARSTYSPGPPPYKRATYTIQPWNDGIKVTYDLVHARGGVTHLEWIGRFDGREYEVQGPDELITYAYSPAPDGSYEVTVRMDGRIAAVSRVMLSADGRSMRTTTRGTDTAGRDLATTIVYDRQ